MISCENIGRTFRSSHRQVTALDDVSMTVCRGEFIVVQGVSGSGKSTLLLTLGGMQRPSQGRVLLEGKDLYALPPGTRNHLRGTQVGFVFQLFHLIPYLDVRENILAGICSRSDRAQAEKRVGPLLNDLGLGDRAHHLPGALSAGERQRTALARALVKQPALILADEPTGNLDPVNASEVFRQLGAFHHDGGTVIVVTHGNDAAPYAQRTLRLEAGRIAPSAPTITHAPAAPMKPPFAP